MKTRNIIIAVISSFISFAATAQSKTTAETIKVWGNCGMCKSHIEKAAKSAGAVSAVWNKDTKLLAVKYSTDKTSNKKIQEAVANAGYDTKDFTANDAAYKKLDECCQYERKAAPKDKQ